MAKSLSSYQPVVGKFYLGIGEPLRWVALLTCLLKAFPQGSKWRHWAWGIEGE
ncbi:MAG: hypothetical protein RMZ69_27535 [Nostoc sp. ChiQUE01a]|nr:hypothetical protein [Nostoc sp. ChiQUE01a]